MAAFGFLAESLCARSSTDRMKACGALDPGSIPGGRTTLVNEIIRNLARAILVKLIGANSHIDKSL